MISATEWPIVIVKSKVKSDCFFKIALICKLLWLGYPVAL